ncbi:MAG: FHA domain-containing protein [Planctomycetota bacterium]|nr:MAG: FHA domain-containing protein [Planctomycetota bacterium]
MNNAPEGGAAPGVGRPSLYVEVPHIPPFEVLLEDDVVTVGRAESNVLILRDMNVSRHHFSLERRGQLGYALQDLGSRNGTLVNERTVLDRLLVPGDRIRVGGSVLTYRAVASPRAVSLRSTRTSPASVPPAPSGFGVASAPGFGSPAAPPLPERPTGRPAPGGSITPPSSVPRLPAATPATSSESIGEEPATVPRPDPRGARWRKLAEVACALNTERDPGRLLEIIIDAVLFLVPSKSAFLVICEGEELVVRAQRNAPQSLVTEGTEAGRLSRQVCREAIAKGRPVLTQDAVSDDELSSFLTVIKLQLKSILCVPIVHKGEALGVVYLDEPRADPFDEDGEAVELVAAFGDLAGIALANARLLEEIAAKERIEEELRIAAQIQRSLLPAAPPRVEGLEIAGRTLPAREVGGDLYDFHVREVPAEDLLISIGDVSGKGVGAGMVMATVRSLLRAFACFATRGDELLGHLNRALTPDLDAGMFVSFLLLRYDPGSGRLRYTGAGHEHLILYRPATRQLETLRAGGVVLGLVDDLRGKIEERELRLLPGDVVCLYTDGATEAQGTGGDELGLDRLAAAVRAGPLDPQAIVERCIRTVLEHTGHGRELHDDLTIVALRKR